MNEKQRTQRIRHELEKAKAELARQDAELEALEAEMDPNELAEAGREAADPNNSDVRAVEQLFADHLPRTPSPEPSLKLSSFAIRV